MGDSRLHNQPALRLQDLLDFFVRSLSVVSRAVRAREPKGTHFNMLSNKIHNFTCEPSTVVDGTRGHLVCGYHTICKQNTVIVVTKSGGLVDDSRPVSISHVGVNENTKTLGRILCGEW